MKVLLISAVVFCLISCAGDAKETVQNGNFKVELLFEQNGCKMYRFHDGGSRVVYWADCSGKVNSDYTTSTGKSTITHHEETITTP